MYFHITRIIDLNKIEHDAGGGWRDFVSEDCVDLFWMIFSHCCIMYRSVMCQVVCENLSLHLYCGSERTLYEKVDKKLIWMRMFAWDSKWGIPLKNKMLFVPYALRNVKMWIRSECNTKVVWILLIDQWKKMFVDSDCKICKLNKRSGMNI